MLLPVLALMFRRAVLDQLAFAADLSAHRRLCSIGARAHPTPGRRALTAALPAAMRDILLRECDVAFDPIAHLARTYAAAAGAGALEREDDGAVEAVAGEADHLAVLCAAGVRAAGGEVCEYVGGGDEDGVGEEYL